MMEKKQAGIIRRITPPNAIPGGEVIIECENFPIERGSDFRCYFNDERGEIYGASPIRVTATIPAEMPKKSHPTGDGATEVKLYCDGYYSNTYRRIVTGVKLRDGLHLVANPAVDSSDGSLIVTRSGSRGQQLPVTLFRLYPDGDLEEISGDIMNPTGIAFSPSGELFVTSRAEGTVYRINRENEALPFASDLGIATGLAFDRLGNMFVGDRSGTIYKINSIGESEFFASLEQSIAAYHLAFGPDGALYVSRPNVASFDAVMRIDEDGEATMFYRGLGRPQGLAFDREGNLYVAASLRQRRGIVRISPDGGNAELFVAGMNIVGLCFGGAGEMFVATNEALYRLPLGIYGTLLD
ncbi:MAG TPA: hypothetical protein VF596_18170 [Pyrinomonadaceae bacterium]|jgi:sugar lactone lactonase YvrE